MAAERAEKEIKNLLKADLCLAGLRGTTLTILERNSDWTRQKNKTKTGSRMTGRLKRGVKKHLEEGLMARKRMARIQEREKQEEEEGFTEKKQGRRDNRGALWEGKWKWGIDKEREEKRKKEEEEEAERGAALV